MNVTHLTGWNSSLQYVQVTKETASYSSANWKTSLLWDQAQEIVHCIVLVESTQGNQMLRSLVKGI